MAARNVSRMLLRTVPRLARSMVPRVVVASSSVNASQGVVSQTRGIKTMNFGGTEETVYERSDMPPAKLKEFFKDDVLAVLGYGPQGKGQSLNMRDNGLNVIVSTREGGKSWKEAIADGWVPGKTLFTIEEAANRGTYIMNLLSDAGQKEMWNKIVPYLKPGKTLYFSHGFSLTFNDKTLVNPPADIDVILCAPKGSGTTLRSLFLENKGLNSSIAVHQDVTGKAKDKAVALGIAIGSGYLYETTVQKEVYSDLFGERGILMGAIYGMFRAQYDVLRANGHSPSESFNETVEEATQSLIPLIGQKGMDWMYANCSATAQRGALDWHQKFYDAAMPVYKDLYKSVINGSEVERALDKNSCPNYRTSLEKELETIRKDEMWRAGETVRSLRPENSK